MRVRVVVPARNEAISIASTVRAVRDLPGVQRVLVVDDASSDGTREEAMRAGAEVVRTPHRLGKGGALRLGLKGLREEVVLFLDGDLGEEARKASALLDPVLGGEAEMCVAKVETNGSGGLGVARGLAAWGIKRLTGFETACPLSGQRALLREVLEAVSPMEGGFGVEVGLTIDALRKGFRVAEVKTGIVHKGTGRGLSGFLHRGRQARDILRALLSRGLLRGKPR